MYEMYSTRRTYQKKPKKELCHMCTRAMNSRKKQPFRVTFSARRITPFLHLHPPHTELARWSPELPRLNSSGSSNLPTYGGSNLWIRGGCTPVLHLPNKSKHKGSPSRCRVHCCFRSVTWSEWGVWGVHCRFRSVTWSEWGVWLIFTNAWYVLMYWGVHAKHGSFSQMPNLC